MKLTGDSTQQLSPETFKAFLERSKRECPPPLPAERKPGYILMGDDIDRVPDPLPRVMYSGGLLPEHWFLRWCVPFVGLAVFLLLMAKVGGLF